VPEAQPISWRSIVYGTPVTAADGIRIGAVRERLRFAVPSDTWAGRHACGIPDTSPCPGTTTRSSPELVEPSNSRDARG
jgi:hypothetical protein